MLFYRQGELTDDKERGNLHLQAQEVGDEYQKGLALCVLSGIFMVAGVVMLIVHAVSMDINTLRIGGIFTIGIGTVFGLPGIAYILLFYKEQQQRKLASDDTAQLATIAHEISDRDTLKLLKSADKLVKKLERASGEQFPDAKTLTRMSLDSTVKKETAEDGIARFRSFSEFGRAKTVSDFEMYRKKLLKDYMDRVVSKPDQDINRYTEEQNQRQTVESREKPHEVEQSIPSVWLEGATEDTLCRNTDNEVDLEQIDLFTPRGMQQVDNRDKISFANSLVSINDPTKYSERNIEEEEASLEHVENKKEC